MKVLLVTACERIINDPEAGACLIALFHDIKIQVQKDAEIPRNAVVPQQWSVFVKFGLEPHEEGKDYTLITDILWPDGTSFVTGYELRANQPTKDGMTFNLRNAGFPMGQIGKVVVRFKLIGDGKDVCEPFEISVNVRQEKIL